MACFPLFQLHPHDNRCIIFHKLCNYRVSVFHKVRPDFSKCATGILKVLSTIFVKIFVNNQILRIKASPKFMFEDNTAQLFAEFNHPAFNTIECTIARSICCQEKCIKAIFNKIKYWTVHSFFISQVFISTSIIKKKLLLVLLLSLHACQFQNSLQNQAESAASSYPENEQMQMMLNAWHV